MRQRRHPCAAPPALSSRGLQVNPRSRVCRTTPNTRHCGRCRNAKAAEHGKRGTQRVRVQTFNVGNAQRWVRHGVANGVVNATRGIARHWLRGKAVGGEYPTKLVGPTHS